MNPHVETPDPKSGASANSATLAYLWCRLSESNQSPTDYKSVALPDELKRLFIKLMVVREGFEPSKAEPSDLQSDPFGRSGTSPFGTP